MNFMEKSDVIKIFLENGYQLDSQALGFFSESPDKINLFIEHIKKHKETSVITYDLVQRILGDTKTEIVVIKDFLPNKKTLSVEDHVNSLSSIYGFFRKIFEKRIDLVNLVSINKISPRTQRFSLIAMVRDVEGNTITLEDQTGTVTVNIKDKFDYIIPDEVLGVVCEKKADSIYVTNIHFPDIPFKKEIKRTNEEIQCIFISDMFSDPKIENGVADKIYNYVKKNKKSIVFFLNDKIADKEKFKKFVEKLPDTTKVVVSDYIDFEGVFKLTNPTMISIHGVSLFLSYKGLDDYIELWRTTPTDTMLNLLKKRHLNPKFTFDKNICGKDQYIFETIPDILVVGGYNTTETINYKGTTICSVGNFSTTPMFWSINLKTREIMEIDLK